MLYALAVILPIILARCALDVPHNADRDLPDGLPDLLCDFGNRNINQGIQGIALDLHVLDKSLVLGRLATMPFGNKDLYAVRFHLVEGINPSRHAFGRHIQNRIGGREFPLADPNQFLPIATEVDFLKGRDYVVAHREREYGGNGKRSLVAARSVFRDGRVCDPYGAPLVAILFERGIGSRRPYLPLFIVTTLDMLVRVCRCPGHCLFSPHCDTKRNRLSKRSRLHDSLLIFWFQTADSWPTIRT